MPTSFQRLLAVALCLAIDVSGAGELSPFMPKEEDRTSMWWGDGFPSAVEGAAWRRCVRTGHYGFVMDTETLKVTGLGPASLAIEKLPPAELELDILVEGKRYRCRRGPPVSRFVGPRLIESGRFLQRADLTGLTMTADDGSALNAELRFETVAWHDRLGLILAARPGRQPIEAAEQSFGRLRGGFGLTGANRLEIPAEHAETPGVFTLEFWVFLPLDYRAGKHAPWLLCKNAHEQADGNYGVILHQDGIPELRMNIGGGRDGALRKQAERRHALKHGRWNHIAVSYDGETARLFSNGQPAAELRIGKQRVPKPGPLVLGDRGDGLDGFRFRGVVDEIRLHNRALAPGELRLRFAKPELEQPASKPLREWSFREDVAPSPTLPPDRWTSASIGIRLANAEGELSSRWELAGGETWTSDEWQQTSLMFDPVSMNRIDGATSLTVRASETSAGRALPVSFEPTLGWHRIQLDEVAPIAPTGGESPSNDAIERVKLVLANPGNTEDIARLMFEKTRFKQRIGFPITGLSAMLRDSAGNPTGIPVQLSKNWHHHAEGGVYSGQWFHGISQVRLPPKSTIELELTMAYGHWGGLPAASHAQLSLIGWGGNQRWDQSALGSWGESICYDPEQAQAAATITDVRPLMVSSINGKPWAWTNNVGGGDFFRLFGPDGERLGHSGMRATYHRHGPCLTEATYTGWIGNTGIAHRETVSLARTDDIVCGTYRIRMDVTRATDFSRFVIFQIGADTYAVTKDHKIAFGDESGLLVERDAQWGGNAYRGMPLEWRGRLPWASLHASTGNGEPEKSTGAWANRGIVIREWRAKLGGIESPPWIAERGVDLRGGKQTSTLDILPPPGVKRLKPGDFVEATIEHLVIPQSAADYYGPNAALRAALAKDGDSWQMVHRQATGGDLQALTMEGTVRHPYPDLRIATANNRARFTLKGGIGYVPITFTGLTTHKGLALTVDGERVDQSVHGRDYWQTDYDATTGTWSQTYNLQVDDAKPTRKIRFGPE